MSNSPKQAWFSSKEMLEIPAEEYSSPVVFSMMPVVSVIMMTRNHECYLRQAVESVVSQQCGFPFEILLGEDFSSDSTRELALSIQRDYPEIVRVIVADHNVGIASNFLRLLVRARGKYIALLEGDDYWIEPKKLQLQIERLEAEPDAAWCATRTSNRSLCVPPKIRYKLKDILRRYIFHTSSIVFRRSLLNEFPWYPDIVCLDNIIFARLAELGDCLFIDAETSYYRRHEGGVWSGSDFYLKLRMTAECVDLVDSYFGGRYEKELLEREVWIYRMQTTLDPGPDFNFRWLCAMRVVKFATPRLIWRSPTSWLLLVLGVAIKPLTVSLQYLRQKLSIRSRLKGLVKH